MGRIITEFGMSYHAYVDDTQLYVSFSRDQPGATPEKVQECLIRIRDWMQANQLKLNDNKTELLPLFSQRPEKLPFKVNIGKNTLESSKEVKNLGVIFDENMNFRTHIRKTAKTCYGLLRAIAKIRKFISKSDCIKLIYATVVSRMDYANSLLIGLPEVTLKPLTRIQNYAARLISKTHQTDHITPVLIDLHWLPIVFRIKFKILLLTFKCIHGLAPSYLSELINVRVPERRTRSADELLLTFPNASTSKFGTTTILRKNFLFYILQTLEQSTAIYKKSKD
jgi:hypothetical protein